MEHRKVPQRAPRRAGAKACLPGLLLAAAQLLTLTPAAEAANDAAAPRSEAGLTGFWALRFDSRNVPAASLLPSVTPAQIAAHKRGDALAIRWCMDVGMPLLMDSGAPIDIVQGRSEISIASEIPSEERHIYLNRRPPDPSIFDPTTDGFSIGHWDGQTLIVDTQGFSDESYTALPGGGFRTPTSRLTERYRLVARAQELEVTFTWTDPHVFAKPHTYAFLYYRVPRGYNAEEAYCDSNDPVRTGFLSRTFDSSGDQGNSQENRR